MQTEKVYTIFDFEKLALQSTQGKAKLRFGIWRNLPRITVYTNDDNDKQNNYGMITAGLDPSVYSTITQKLNDIVGAPNGTKFKVENYTSSKDNDTGKWKQEHVNDILMGKDDAGVIWISVIATDRPKFKFEFGNFRYHKFYNTDGQELSKAEISQIATKATIKLLDNLYATYLTNNYEHFNPADYKKKGGNTQYNSGNRTSNYDISDDDIPM